MKIMIENMTKEQIEININFKVGMNNSMKKSFVNIILVMLLILSIAIIFSNINSIVNFKIEEKTVWITSDVIEEVNYESGSSYFVRYDDKKGEKGILRTNSNGNDLKKGTSVTVYKNANGLSGNDSTHGWELNIDSIKRTEVFNIVLGVAFSVIFIAIIIKRKNTGIKESESNK